MPGRSRMSDDGDHHLAMLAQPLVARQGLDGGSRKIAPGQQGQRQFFRDAAVGSSTQQYVGIVRLEPLLQWPVCSRFAHFRRV